LRHRGAVADYIFRISNGGMSLQILVFNSAAVALLLLNVFITF
jgi:hypothetical protein